METGEDILCHRNCKGPVTTPIKSVLHLGSILTVINCGGRIFLHRNMRAMDWIKLAVIYCVPYANRSLSFLKESGTG